MIGETGDFDDSCESAFGGQSAADWSATYLNSSVDVALSYLPTKLEKFENCYLIRCRVREGSDKKLLVPLKERFDQGRSLEDQILFETEILRAACEKHYGGLDDFKPMLQKIGRNLNCHLLTLDHDDLEISVPHGNFTGS